MNKVSFDTDLMQIYPLSICCDVKRECSPDGRLDKSAINAVFFICQTKLFFLLVIIIKITQAILISKIYMRMKAGY
jgi:hypothetical protein